MRKTIRSRLFSILIRAVSQFAKSAKAAIVYFCCAFMREKLRTEIYMRNTKMKFRDPFEISHLSTSGVCYRVQEAYMTNKQKKNTINHTGQKFRVIPFLARFSITILTP